MDRLIWRPFLKNIADREKEFSTKEREIEDILHKIDEINEIYTTTIQQKERQTQLEIEEITKRAYAKQRELIDMKQKESRVSLAEYEELLKNIHCAHREDFAPHIDSIVEEMYKAITQRKHLL